MKRIMLTLPSIFLWFGSCCIATAQDTASSDQITADQQIIQDDRSTTGKFQPVTVGPSATSDVALQFPQSLANKSVAVQPLDGGTLQIGNSTIDQNGMLSFSFQVTDQPGVYRVAVVDPNTTDDTQRLVGLVQFEVPNPAQ